MPTVNIYDMADTWNAIGTTFNGIYMNFTDGAGGAPVGAATSRFLRLDNDGAPIFAVDSSGTIYGPVFGTMNIGDGLGVPDTVALNAKVRFTSGGYIFNGTNPFDFTFASGNNNNTVYAGWDTDVGVLSSGFVLGWSSVGHGTSFTNAVNDTGMSRVGAADIAFGNGTALNATATIRCGALRINQTPAANGSAATTITNGADSATNLGHQLSINLNGTTYFIPCGNTAF